MLAAEADRQCGARSRLGGTCIEGEHFYVYFDGIVLKRSWAGEVRKVSVVNSFSHIWFGPSGRPALAQAVAAPLICWSFSSSIFK
jgi:hypothetical protein